MVSPARAGIDPACFARLLLRFCFSTRSCPTKRNPAPPLAHPDRRHPKTQLLLLRNKRVHIKLLYRAPMIFRDAAPEPGRRHAKRPTLPSIRVRLPSARPTTAPLLPAFAQPVGRRRAVTGRLQERQQRRGFPPPPKFTYKFLSGAPCKAPFFSGCESRPATVAPAGSSRSG